MLRNERKKKLKWKTGDNQRLFRHQLFNFKLKTVVQHSKLRTVFCPYTKFSITDPFHNYRKQSKVTVLGVGPWSNIDKIRRSGRIACKVLFFFCNFFIFILIICIDIESTTLLGFLNVFKSVHIVKIIL